MSKASRELNIKFAGVVCLFGANAYALHRIGKINNEGKRFKAGVLSLVALGATFTALAVLDEVFKGVEDEAIRETLTEEPVPVEVEAPANVEA